MENTVKQRLIKYLKYKDITQREFADIVGLSSGYVNAIRKGILPDTLHKIAVHFPDLNTGWVITGEGDMLKQIQQVGDNNSGILINGNNSNSPIDSHYYSDSPDVLKAQIELLDARIKEKDAQIKEKDAQINSLLAILSECSKKNDS